MEITHIRRTASQEQAVLCARCSAIRWGVSVAGILAGEGEVLIFTGGRCSFCTTGSIYEVRPMFSESLVGKYLTEAFSTSQ